MLGAPGDTRRGTSPGVTTHTPPDDTRREDREIPAVRCPECGHIEPRAFVGARTGATVQLDARHFTDERGYFYCRACFVVWDRIPLSDRHLVLGDEYADGTRYTHNRERIEPYMRLGAFPGFLPKEAKDTPRFSRLEWTQRKVNAADTLGSTQSRKLRRAGDRLRDADTLCTALGLKDGARSRVLHHVERFTVDADLRRFPRTASGRSPREEAYTVAATLLACERDGLAVDAEIAYAHFTFTQGERHLTPEELAAAERGLRAWFTVNLWN